MCLVVDQALMGTTDQPRATPLTIQEEEREPQTVRKSGQSGTHAQGPIGGLPILGKELLRKGFDKETVGLITDAWRPSTKKTYSCYLRKWSTYCLVRGIDPVKPTLPQACRFLRILSGEGLDYGGLNAARCALSTILPPFEGISFGNHPLGTGH